MSGDQPVGAVEEALVDRQGAFNAFPDTGNGEVVISHRGRDEDGPGSQNAQQLGEVEGHAAGVAPVEPGDARHIALVAPALQVSAVVVAEGIEAATGGHRQHSRFEGRQEKGVVTAQGVADHADPAGVDFRQRLQQIDGPAVVENAFHGGAGVAHGVGIDLVIPEPRVVRRQGDVAAPGQFQA